MSSSTLSNKPRANRRLFAPSARCPGGLPRYTWLTPWLAASMLLAARLATAQEALRDSLAGDAAAEARKIQLESLPYTFKSGDFRLLVVPSLGLDWNDNINCSKTDPEQDFILSPLVQLNASYPITQNNLLNLNVGAGYDKYLDHDQYSTWRLQSGTELSFDIYVKDFWFNLHDRAQYVQDTSQQPALAGTATYATFNNTAGLSVTWDLNKVKLSAGYDHENVISPTSQQYESQDGATEMVFARAGLEVYPGVTTGIEGTGSFTTYDQMVLNDNNSYSAGVYADWRPGKAFRVQPRVGYTIFQFQHTSQTIQTSDLNSWYADLNITHQVTDAIGYTLDAGHEVQTGIQSDAIEDYYVRPSIHWDIIKNVKLNTSFSYEHGNQGEGNVLGNLTETFDWLGASVGASYSIFKKLSLGLNYRLTVRSSNIPNKEYTQNMVGLSLTYLTQ
ncbi:MAG: outer membrane beta-barrel protein [Verrucomicrobiota bacterium]